MINFSTTCELKSNNQLENISNILVESGTAVSRRLAHKAIVAHIQLVNGMRDCRIVFDFADQSAIAQELAGRLSQDLIKFDNEAFSV